MAHSDKTSGASKEIGRPGSIYSFGETDLAAERLRVVAEVFDPTSEPFVSGAVRNRPRLALDLGCGPGFTTRLLSRITRSDRTVGVDRSEASLSRARASSIAGEEYFAADVAVLPLGIAGIGAQPDLIYARFLASHLPEPGQTISGWAKELEPDGLLLVEEVEDISAKVAAFDEYLNILSQMLAWHGNELCVGARLATTQWNTDVWIDINRAKEVRPTIRQAARMFSLNFSNWRHDPYVEAAYPSDKLESLAIKLERLTASAEAGQIIWRIRQICLRRRAKSYGTLVS
jgi:trans-aconitate 2-methyltransferase